MSTMTIFNTLWEKLEGWKTFSAVAPILLHQIMKGFGFDIEDPQISAAIDGFLAFLGLVFRAMAKPKVKEEVSP